MSEYNLKTGDLLLLDYEGSGIFGWFTWLIKFFTKSDYSHIVMILKDPDFLDKKLKGYYVWESSYNGTKDPQDGKVKIGVQITPLDEILNHYKKEGGKIWIRRCNYKENPFTNKKLKAIHDIVYDKPYDIMPQDWIEALFRKDGRPQKTDRFWCSALTGYIYSHCDVISSKTDWSLLRPVDFSIQGDSFLNFTNGNCLEDIQERIL